MIAALVIAGVALAGEPPSEVIPWDSVFIQDTIVTPAGDTAVTEGYWCKFIRKVDYEARVLGMKASAEVSDIRRDLQAIRAILKAKEKR